jgi:hypothetical protein
VVLSLASLALPATAQLPKLKVASCTRTINAAVAPFAVASRQGWYRRGGYEVEVVPLPGSTDCVKLAVTRELDFSLPSVEPLATRWGENVEAKYAAYVDLMLEWGIMKERVAVSDLVTNELVDESEDRRRGEGLEAGKVAS